MKSVYINDLVSGMYIAKPIYSLNGDLLLESGTKINKKIINSIRNTGITAVFIYAESLIDMHTKLETVNIMYKHFNECMDIESFSKRKGVIPDQAYDDIKKVMNKIFNIIKNNNEVLVDIKNIMEKDFYTYEHSLNVSVLSILVGLEIGYSEEIVIDIGIGALLHDIGKILITDSILNKPGKLTKEEYEIIKRHPVFGYEFIKDNKGLSELTKEIVLYHHERIDGSGYPEGIKINSIKNGKYINIVSFLDVFDAMTNDRIYKEKMPIYLALEFVSSQVPTILDMKVFEVLKSRISPFPPGTYVELTTGEKGIVVKNNHEEPTRPTIKVLFNQEGEAVEDEQYIDLMKNLITFIKDIYELKE
jgi:HD-GYP domain-containing protein (c-di-GMP phosphodiesterase class II)